MKAEGSLAHTDLREPFSYPLTLRVNLIPFSPIRTPTACCVAFFVPGTPGMRRGSASPHAWLPNFTPIGVMRDAITAEERAP